MTSPPETRWTPELQADVKRLALGGLSYSEIGKLHNVSRSAIGGCISRMRDAGLFPLLAPPGDRKGPKPKLLRQPPTDASGRPNPSGHTMRSKPAPKPPRIAAGAGKRVLLKDLEPNCCKYATGYDKHGRHLFCGAATEGSSWCIAHSQRVYQPRGMK